MSRYFYLEASLPSLKRDDAPLITVEAFLDLCAEWVDPKRMDFLSKLQLRPVEGLDSSIVPSVAIYLAWEKDIREGLAKTRAAKLGRSDSGLSEPENFSFDADRLVQEAAAAPNPLERERVIDFQRWRKLEDLELNHIFDFDILCIYKLKLLLRCKWQVRQLAKGAENLDKAVAAVQASPGGLQAAPSA